MGRKHRRRRRASRKLRPVLSVCAILLVIVLGVTAARLAESRMQVQVQNAGMQMTAHVIEESAMQVFMNDRWYRKKDVETLLVVGIDDYSADAGSQSYNNASQADFLVLYILDKSSGENKAIHINRDTMTDITVLGVTGEAAGTQHAQIALAFNYGQGHSDSSRNTAKAVSNLLYGMTVDHYITVTMDAVPIMNDWAGGVTVQVLDDMTGSDSSLVLGEEVTLHGQQALDYVRTRRGLEDSTNVNRMERQRQYASAWLQAAQDKLQNVNAVADLVLQMSDYHDSDCTAEEMAALAEALGKSPSVEVHEIPGESVRGEEYIEYYVDETALQQMLLELFFEPTGI